MELPPKLTDVSDVPGCDAVGKVERASSFDTTSPGLFPHLPDDGEDEDVSRGRSDAVQMFDSGPKPTSSKAPAPKKESRLERMRARLTNRPKTGPSQNQAADKEKDVTGGSSIGDPLAAPKPSVHAAPGERPRRHDAVEASHPRRRRRPDRGAPSRPGDVRLLTAVWPADC